MSSPRDESATGTIVQELLASSSYATDYVRWCDGTQDWAGHWARLGKLPFPDDSLLAPNGGFVQLPAAEFLSAYRATGAEVTRQGGTRAFDVAVDSGNVRVAMGVKLYRGSNTQEWELRVHRGEERVEVGSMAGYARAIILASIGTDILYPKVAAVSRSQLAVTSREVVATLRRLAAAFPA